MSRKTPACAQPVNAMALPLIACACAQVANACLECQVVSRMEAGDHWLIYASVLSGKVLDDAAQTAVHHRKVGNHY